MITAEHAKKNVRHFLKEKVSKLIGETSSNGQQEVRIYLDADFELLEEVLSELRTQGYEASLDGHKYSIGFALDVSWK
jgi:hypothetical protein